MLDIFNKTFDAWWSKLQKAQFRSNHDRSRQKTVRPAKFVITFRLSHRTQIILRLLLHRIAHATRNEILFGEKVQWSIERAKIFGTCVVFRSIDSRSMSYGIMMNCCIDSRLLSILPSPRTMECCCWGSAMSWIQHVIEIWVYLLNWVQIMSKGDCCTLSYVGW